MDSFKVRELQDTDAQALLEFEVRNRQWFESHIEPRAPEFYSLQGVVEHIASCLDGLASGNWHPMVILDYDQRIIGRANLKSIDAAAGCAEVGYRIDQQAAGQGLATFALKRLIHEARNRWRLGQLVAFVYEQNLGSQKVLARCGFLPAPDDADGSTANERRFVLSLEAHAATA
jgi:ribosomal-protein-alanine N-acetyltransferase